MNRNASTVKEYLDALPADRRKDIEAVRKVLRQHLPDGVQEGMQYGMIGYFVPHKVYPAGYHCDPKQPLPFAGLAAQKNHLSLYMMFMYPQGGHEAEFKKAWISTGRKLDMGRCCVRFKSASDAALDVIAAAFDSMTVKDYVDLYERAIKSSAKPRPAKKTVKKKTAARKR
jgi:hypothetical protein